MQSHAAPAVGRVQSFTSAQMDAVQQYVRAHRNRPFIAPGRSSVYSKPLTQIASELDMHPGAVRDALTACGWSQAARDASEADTTAEASQ